jgi:inorganic triphosphatase YgiF
MQMSKEVELKLELPAASLPAIKKLPMLRARAERPERTNEVSVYFDTDKHNLREKGLMLRVRRIGHRYVQTIKASENGGAFERDEWEADIPGEMPDLGLAKGTALEALVKKKLRKQLKPLFETRVQRTLYRVGDKKQAIAMTLDRGRIDSGKRSIPLCEIELELQRGNARDLFDIARAITQTVPATLGMKSKSERGYELLEKKDDAPAKAVQVHLASAASARDAFRAIGRACLKQVVSNHPALMKGDPEGVHQMRVGLRRLRAAMSLFSDLLGDQQIASIKAELKWLTGELGPARELEVLVKRVIAPTKKEKARWPGLSSFSQELTQKRELALERAQDAVRSSRFRSLMLEVAAWLEAGQWRAPEDAFARDRGALAIPVFAAAELKRRFRKIKKNGKHLGQLDSRSRHKLRIQVKKVRYAAQFFESLFAGNRAAKRRTRFLAALERLQDGLGDLNDIAIHEQRMEALGLHQRRASRKQAFAAGLLTGHEDARADAAMAAAKKAYAELVESKRFW